MKKTNLNTENEPKYEDKYDLTIDQNCFILYRNVADYIWKFAQLEKIPLSYPEIVVACNSLGYSFGKEKANDVRTIRNMKFVFGTYDYGIPLCICSSVYDDLCLINKQLIMNNYDLNKIFNDTFGDTFGKANKKNESDYQTHALKTTFDELVKTLFNNSEITKTERAIEILLCSLRLRLFEKFNITTCFILANTIMVNGGCGCIVVPIEKQEEFLTLLDEFYNNNDKTPLKTFLYTHCIDGIDLRTQEKSIKEQLKKQSLTKK